MTSGTLLAFATTSIIVLVAIVGGIWLETRMSAPQDQRLSPLLHLHPLLKTSAADHRSELAAPADQVPLAAAPPTTDQISHS